LIGDLRSRTAAGVQATGVQDVQVQAAAFDFLGLGELPLALASYTKGDSPVALAIWAK